MWLAMVDSAILSALCDLAASCLLSVTWLAMVDSILSALCDLAGHGRLYLVCSTV